MSLYFDLLAPLYDLLVHPRPPEILIEELLRHTNSDISRMCEVGGGTGRVAQYLLPYVDEMWILDSSRRMLERAKHKNIGLRLVHGRGEQLPFEREYLDGVLIYDTLHHLEDAKTVLLEVYRTLRRQGLLVIADIHPKHRWGYFTQQMERVALMRSTFYTPGELGKLLMETGFKVIQIRWEREPTYIIIARKKGKVQSES